jgi:hypothetical protein
MKSQHSGPHTFSTARKPKEPTIHDLIADVLSAHPDDLTTQAHANLRDFLNQNGPQTVSSNRRLGYDYQYMFLGTYPGWRRVPVPPGETLTDEQIGRATL